MKSLNTKFKISSDISHENCSAKRIKYHKVISDEIMQQKHKIISAKILTRKSHNDSKIRRNHIRNSHEFSIGSQSMNSHKESRNSRKA